ncbi:ABC-type transport auxiliary lipoprotein family protein [Sphingomonas sp. CFBP8993]|uniref:ABC-type transport auxiliary lipoprotein family protein n=1 Tax=Sphingomonas sp. CFBP8993 TaxID=3096526 RepID=UPI002A6A2B4B|nr:ABC-type transport auxiliary lipoprotein family protein [Sphingomonas sp. CFBP8993]MDY0958101.1 ABC-type transport auxiliary lipoprotein family protein [Sphingomonas sp. CFBP8993]
MKTPLIVMLASLPLAGCISFGAKPPPSLLTLQAQSAPDIGQTQDSARAKSITIQVPTSPQELATARVPVQEDATSIAYVKDAQWAEPPARLFARLMADTMTARAGRVVLSARESVGDPGDRLAGELRHFGMDATRRDAVVTFDAALQRDGQTGIEKRRFEARVPVGKIDADSVGPALNQAANQVAQQVTDWVGR